MVCLVFDYLFLILLMQVHVLPREMLGMSTFGIAMALLKWFPLRLVDKLLVLVATLAMGNTDQLGLKRPKTGPIELKNVTGKTPVLDAGALSQIKSGKIKVNQARPNKPFIFYPPFLACMLLLSAIPSANPSRVSSGDARCEGDNKKWSQIYEWTRKGVRVYNPSNWIQKQCAYLAQGKHHIYAILVLLLSY